MPSLHNRLVRLILGVSALLTLLQPLLLNLRNLLLCLATPCPTPPRRHRPSPTKAHTYGGATESGMESRPVHMSQSCTIQHAHDLSFNCGFETRTHPKLQRACISRQSAEICGLADESFCHQITL